MSELFNESAEESLIGSIILDGVGTWRRLVDIRRNLGVSFWYEKNRLIWKAFESLMEEESVIDVVTITDRLAKDGNVERAGGTMHITHCVNNTPTALHAKHYAEIILELGRRRHIAAQAKKAVLIAEDQTKDIADALAEVAAVGEFAAPVGSSIISLRSALKDALSEMEEAAQRALDGGSIGAPSSIPSLSSMLGGYVDGTLTVLAARPGVGKSAFAMQEAMSIVDSGRQVLCLSFEMTATELAKRLLSSAAQVDITDLRAGQMKKGEWDRTYRAMQDLVKRGDRLLFGDRVAHIADVREQVEAIRIETGTAPAVILDYIQIMDLAPTVKRGDNGARAIGETTRQAKRIAQDLRCPVIALSQLNRGLESREDKRPLTSDLRQSGEIEQDADAVIMLYRPQVYDDTSLDPCEILVRKNRNGRTGTILATFEHGVYEEQMAPAVPDLVPVIDGPSLYEDGQDYGEPPMF